ncbi:enoyl-CoA hydratase [Scopulibacillus darangshiensis]|uniref:Enoyl-CoA hydratase n=1 Tax=Scopulibacillus darangshiensis TaxID=442528 RepID=A0A4R2PDG1_9BACL|nr:enoyl-CoA hydratase [Scopulibacillus darangshiensis]TCP32131.1 enoyl-CoA hydratase [Scopulibacillus darangshiensis]
MTVLHLETKNRTAVITIDRPPANALSSEVIEELNSVINELEDQAEIKALVIHGKDRFFSAGADIKEFTEIEDTEGFARLSAKGQELFNRMENFKKPIIAAIHGAALGGGLELAMACHIRMAARGAKFGLPELQLGLIPGFAGTQRLPQLVGVPKATELILSSQPIEAEEAKALGLVNQVVEPEELFDKALGLASRIVSKSAVSTALALECLSYARRGDYLEGQSKESVNFGIAFNSEDAKEGIQAFIEKRKPAFQDK